MTTWRSGVTWLLRAANLLHVPVVATEQYPQGLGGTAPALLGLLPEGAQAVSHKVHFSCAAGQCFDGAIAPPQQQVIVCGIEAHVCVLQTVLELLDNGRSVFVVADAIGSRNPFDRTMAIERMQRHGAQIVTREMVGFEWLRTAGTDEFRAFSKTLLRAER